MWSSFGFIALPWIALLLIAYGIAHFTSSALIEYKSSHVNVSKLREAILNICLLITTGLVTFLSLVLAVIMVIFHD